MLQFLARPAVRRFNRILFLISFGYVMASLVAGCASPTWLTDATNLIPVLTASVTGWLAFLAQLTGNEVSAAVLTEIATLSTDVENGLKSIEGLVEEYNANPSDDLLQNIEGAVQLVVTNLQSILTQTGLPSAVASKVQAFAQLVLSELQAWASLIPSLKSTLSPMSTITLTVPYTKRQFKEKFNSILDAKTGDPLVDAALAKVKRF